MKTNLFMRQAAFVATVLLTALLAAACEPKPRTTTGEESTQADTSVTSDVPAVPTDEAAPTLTFADVAGVYDSYDDDGSSFSRIVLEADGTATWGMVGSLHFTPYTYTIEGDGVVMKYDDDTERDYYTYDAAAGTLSNEQGAVYYRQNAED